MVTPNWLDDWCQFSLPIIYNKKQSSEWLRSTATYKIHQYYVHPDKISLSIQQFSFTQHFLHINIATVSVNIKYLTWQKYFYTHAHRLQWNSSIAATLGELNFGRYNEGLFCTKLKLFIWDLGSWPLYEVAFIQGWPLRGVPPAP